MNNLEWNIITKCLIHNRLVRHVLFTKIHQKCTYFFPFQLKKNALRGCDLHILMYNNLKNKLVQGRLLYHMTGAIGRLESTLCR